MTPCWYRATTIPRGSRDFAGKRGQHALHALGVEWFPRDAALICALPPPIRKLLRSLDKVRTSSTSGVVRNSPEGMMAYMATESHAHPMKLTLTAVLLPAPEGGFTALNPETGTTSQGETIDEALANLREATELFLEEFPLTPAGQPLVTTFQIAVNA